MKSGSNTDPVSLQAEELFLNSGLDIGGGDAGIITAEKVPAEFVGLLGCGRLVYDNGWGLIWFAGKVNRVSGHGGRGLVCPPWPA